MRYALLSLLLASAFAQTVPPATPADKPKEPTAAQQFKNIQVLKDVPVREWFPTMAFISGSLGVGCDHCHVNPFPKDDKPAKARAREMMRMVQQINARIAIRVTSGVGKVTAYGSVIDRNTFDATYVPAQ